MPINAIAYRNLTVPQPFNASAKHCHALPCQCGSLHRHALSPPCVAVHILASASLLNAVLCQSFARLSPCSARPRSAVPMRFCALPLLGCSALSHDHALLFLRVATQYHRASRPRHARALPRIATLCRSGSLLCLSLAEPLPASQCLSTAGQRLSKQCLSFALPIPRLALQNCTVPLRSHAMPMRNRSKQCPSAYRCPAIQCLCSSRLSCADA